MMTIAFDELKNGWLPVSITDDYFLYTYLLSTCYGYCAHIEFIDCATSLLQGKKHMLSLERENEQNILFLEPNNDSTFTWYYFVQDGSDYNYLDFSNKDAIPLSIASYMKEMDYGMRGILKGKGDIKDFAASIYNYFKVFNTPENLLIFKDKAICEFDLEGFLVLESLVKKANNG